MAKPMSMAELAQQVAEDIYDGDPEADLVTREIASADDKEEAIRRLETLKDEVEAALVIVRAANAEGHACDDRCRDVGCRKMHGGG